MKLKPARVKNYTVYFKNQKEFHILKREIFGSHSYYVEFDSNHPYIIDAGAHIGLATLYFKTLAPQAEILCIEPNPAVLPILEKNIFENFLDNVTVESVALWDQDGAHQFFADSSTDEWYSTAGFIEGAWNRSQQSQTLTVATRPLSFYLDRPVDLLKLDIEGVESEVLRVAGSALKNVSRLLIEFHGVGTNSLTDIIQLLEHMNFQIEVQKGQRVIPPQLYSKVTGLALIEAHQQV